MELTVPSVEFLLKVEIDDNFVPKLRMKVNQNFNFTLPNSGGRQRRISRQIADIS